MVLMQLDERTGKERKTNVDHLVCAKGVNEARMMADALYKDTFADYKLHTVKESGIVEVIARNFGLDVTESDKYRELSLRSICIACAAAQKSVI